MTTKIICSVLDVKAGFYATPFVSINEDIACRDFGAVVRDPNTMLSKFPEDFRLVAIAEFDDITGQVIPHSTPKFLVDAIAFIKE